ncbi:MAG: hypothetical protein O2971_00455 [Proteobacteria bacterium]|nr:hypothetical protein [Pseudomonadota bacterium]
MSEKESNLRTSVESIEPALNNSLPIPEGNPEGYLQRLNHYLALSLSIPERTARALSALVGGSTLLLTKTLVPSAIKNSMSYRFTVGMFQAFLIQNVAGVRDYDDMELKDQFVQRKLLGTSLEAAGLLTMHLSPVWVFAIATDAAKGGQVFLRRLVHHLQANQVIAKDSNPETLEQILELLQEMGRQSATAIDTPPMSAGELRELVTELRRSTVSVTEKSSSLLPRFETLWNQITRVAKKENLSVEQVLGILSVSAAALAETGIGTADAVGRTGYNLIDDAMLNDYKATLSDISDQGV